MHDGDKIGASGIGSLVWKDGQRRIVNPFDEGQELLSKLQDQAKHISSLYTYCSRYLSILNNNLDLTTAVIQRVLCTMRMSSTYNLV